MAQTGTFLGIPYDWRRPTWQRLKERSWNAQDDRMFTPHVFGWGWSINLQAVARRLGLIGSNTAGPRRR
jgi:hypothetical protein